jgi:glycosyltransferase involved in cell wall biosynthesis
MKVSILILTHNEEANLPACLSALSWCDDILVLDSGSTDRTLYVAKSNGARILSRPFDNFADQRNHGLEFGEFRHDWVLHLDADEIVTREFASAIQALTPPAGVNAYRIPSKAILFGHWLRHAGMWPVYQVRLGQRTHLRFKQVGHGQQEDMPSGQVGEFSEPYLHYSFSNGMRRWLEKHIRYAEDEAKYVRDQRARSTFSIIFAGRGDGTSLRRRAKAVAAHLPFFLRPFVRFLYVYFLRQGFRDGRAGLAYAMMLSVYEGMVSVFCYESIFCGRGQEIILISSTTAEADAEKRPVTPVRG